MRELIGGDVEGGPSGRRPQMITMILVEAETRSRPWCRPTSDRQRSRIGSAQQSEVLR